MTLAGWAERTRQVTLGCLVSGAAYRNPALLVRMVVALDHASAGRAILGLGAGWHATEHHAFGYAYPSLGQRLDRLEEAAAICRQMLDGKAAELTGAWFSVHGARAEPRPLQPHLPLLIGGSGERRTIPLVARVADIWNGEGEPADWERRSRLLDDACRAVGRDPSEVRRTVGLPPPLIRSDRLEAVEALAAQLTHHGLQPEAARAASQASQLVGDVPRVVARLRAYMVAGVEEVIFDWPSPLDEATLLALAGPVRAALSGGEAGVREDDGS
jgi:alkanesulfonate monooxygenase SsuD/methylene tetrahydromethanopterin reductase-like flavin-dependent oxidoreductase (luciferase family)